MSEEAKNQTKQKQAWYPKRGEETRYHKNQKYINPKKEESYQKNRQPQLDAKFLKLIEEYPTCFSQTKISNQDRLPIPIDECLIILLKSDQKIRKKSDFQKNAYQKPSRCDEDDEKEPEWMKDDSGQPDINEFQIKTLEYDFKKSQNVKKSFEDRLKQTNTDKELFADVDQLLERQNKEIDYASKLEKPKKAFLSDSDSDDMCFEKLLEKSQKRNQQATYEQVEVQRNIEKNPIYPQLYQKCQQIYLSDKEYNRMKLFIDFTRQITSLDINDNVWYYEDPQKKIQGPFSSVDMDVWNLDQYFPPNLQISWKQSKQFVTISSFKENPLQIIQIAYQHQESIIQCLQIDKQEVKKPPQGFENFNKQSFSMPQVQPSNFLITQNNYQISQNNFQIPLFNNQYLQQQPIAQPLQLLNQPLLSSLNTGQTQPQAIGNNNNFNDFFQNFYQPSQNQLQGKQDNINSLGNNQNQTIINNINQPLKKDCNDIDIDFISNLLNPIDSKKEKSKKIDIQSKPEEKNVQLNVNQLSEADLKQMLGIQSQTFFKF